MKITTKTTKEQLTKFLGVNAKAVQKKDKDLFDRMVYSSDMMKKDQSKVTRKDLVDLAKEVIALLGNKCSEPAMTPVAESSVKKLNKKTETKKDSSDEVKGEKKTTKKSATKKQEKVVELNPVDNKKSVQMAKAFPKTLEVGDNKYELAEDIKTMDDLYTALSDEEETVVFAYYWTKRHLKQYDYFNGYLGQPKEFEKDLDLATAIHISDEKKVSYQLSMYTEAIYTILPEDLEEEDGIRIAGGIEFQIYRQVE